MGAVADDNNNHNLKSASGGAFKSIQLGGTFAYWHARNNAQLEHIDALETLTESLKEENANLKKQLDTSQTKHCHAERCLKAEQAVSRELNERLESAMNAAAKDREEAARTKIDSQTAVQEANERCKAALDELEAHKTQAVRAQFEAQQALEGKLSSENEASDLAKRIADLLSQVSSLTTRSDNLEKQLEGMTRQRDHHCAHSDLLLKEKNRLIDANTALKRKLADMAQKAAAEAAAAAAAAQAVTVPTANMAPQSTPPPGGKKHAPVERSPVSILSVSGVDNSPSPSPPPPAPMRQRRRPSSATPGMPQPSPAQVKAARDFAWQAAGAMEARRLGPTWIR